MDIISRINDDLYRFLAAGGADPAFLYLGGRDYLELTALMEFTMFVSTPEGEIVDRKRYNGMEVYRVDVEQHIGFGGIKE